MKILLTRILLKYEITLNEKTISPLEYDPTEFILTAKDGVHPVSYTHLVFIAKSFLTYCYVITATCILYCNVLLRLKITELKLKVNLNNIRV